MARYRIAVIPGDGVGPEVMSATLRVLEAAGFDAEFVVCEAGYAYWKKTGKQISDETFDNIRSSDAVLKGPTQTPPGPQTFKSVAVTLRQTFDLYANLRPLKAREGVPCLRPDMDIVVVRENTEGLYKGIEYRLTSDVATSVRVITRKGSERIARFAFEYAKSHGRKRVTCVHKANIMKESCGLFREVCAEVAKQYPEIEFNEMHVDATAMRIVTNPKDLDVIVTTNLFGDILSDEIAGFIGGVGMAPGANIGDRYAMFEPVHGTGPGRAGKNLANPSAMILSAVLMLDYLGEKELAWRVEEALNLTLRERKAVTIDLGGTAKTTEMTEEIVRNLDRVGE